MSKWVGGREGGCLENMSAMKTDHIASSPSCRFGIGVRRVHFRDRGNGAELGEGGRGREGPVGQTVDRNHISNIIEPHNTYVDCRHDEVSNNGIKSRGGGGGAVAIEPPTTHSLTLSVGRASFQQDNRGLARSPEETAKKASRAINVWPARMIDRDK